MIRENKTIALLRIPFSLRSQALYYYEMEKYEDGILLVEKAEKNFFGTLITDAFFEVPLKLTKKEERAIINWIQKTLRGV